MGNRSCASFSYKRSHYLLSLPSTFFRQCFTHIPRKLEATMTVFLCSWIDVIAQLQALLIVEKTFVGSFSQFLEFCFLSSCQVGILTNLQGLFGAEIDCWIRCGVIGNCLVGLLEIGKSSIENSRGSKIARKIQPCFIKALKVH